MTMADYHQEEDLAKERIRKKNPNHPILKKYFGSTYDAVEAYWKVETELDKNRTRSVDNGKRAGGENCLK